MLLIHNFLSRYTDLRVWVLEIYVIMFSFFLDDLEIGQSHLSYWLLHSHQIFHFRVSIIFELFGEIS